MNRFVPPQERHAAPYVKPPAVTDDLSWDSYGANPGQTRHSAIRQVTPDNVAHLRPAWTYATGELARRGPASRHGKFQNTPILAAGHLIVCTPFNRVVALDPATGRERWFFEPNVATDRGVPGEKFNCRALARWRDTSSPDAAT